MQKIAILAHPANLPGRLYVIRFINGVHGRLVFTELGLSSSLGNRAASVWRNNAQQLSHDLTKICCC